MKRIAIIPARGGSKRIKGKNIRHFCGAPIINYPILAALESKLFEKIHISTDDEKIASAVESIGIKIDFLRPPTLADDHTPLMPVLKYVIDTYQTMNVSFDEVWLILPCNPFITSQDLIKANSIFCSSTPRRPLMSISEYNAPIEWALDKGPNNCLSPLTPGAFSIRSQDLVPKYFDAASFYIFNISFVLSSEGSGTDKGYIGYPVKYAVDIDNEKDWEIAESLYLGSMQNRNKINS